MDHTLTLQSIEPLTHDVYHLRFDRPEGYDFSAGQANHWGLDIDGFRDAGNPFTITSLPEQSDRLDFVIKVYPTDEHPDHGGVTERIAKLKPGAKVFVDEPGGDIHDQGPGVFVAGGAGVTPFIPILRKRQSDGALEGCTLVFSNKTERDIILREEWERMEGLRTVFTVTEQDESDLAHARIDGAFLRDHVDMGQRFYVCGPPPMMKDVIADLRAAGVSDDRIVVEEKWLN